MNTMVLAAAGLLLALPAHGAGPGLDWLSGAWCGEKGSASIEEHWTSPVGSTLLGVGRTVKDGRTVSFEYMRVADRDGTLSFVAQPGGAPPTAFALVESGAQSARFANPEHDFPQSVRYWREGETLRAEIAGPDGKGGERRIGFDYRRCAS